MSLGLSTPNGAGRWRCNAANNTVKSVVIRQNATDEKTVFQPTVNSSDDQNINTFGMEDYTSLTKPTWYMTDAYNRVISRVFVVNGTKPVCIGADASTCTVVKDPKYYIHRDTKNPGYKEYTTILAVESASNAKLTIADFKPSGSSYVDFIPTKGKATDYNAFFCKTTSIPAVYAFGAFTDTKSIVIAPLTVGNFTGFGNWSLFTPFLISNAHFETRFINSSS